MSRVKGNLSSSKTFEVNNTGLLDARQLVPLKADLEEISNWTYTYIHPISGDEVTGYKICNGFPVFCAEDYNLYLYQGYNEENSTYDFSLETGWKLIGSAENIDLSDYVTQDVLSDYALTTDIPTVPTKVSEFENDAGYLTEHQDLSAYATTDALNQMKTDILGEGVSETFDTLKEIQAWIEGDGVNATELTQAIAAETAARTAADSGLDSRIQTIENDYLKSANLNGYVTEDTLESYATQEWVDEQGFKTQISSDDINDALTINTSSITKVNLISNGYEASETFSIQSNGGDATLYSNKLTLQGYVSGPADSSYPANTLYSSGILGGQYFIAKNSSGSIGHSKYGTNHIIATKQTGSTTVTEIRLTLPTDNLSEQTIATQEWVENKNYLALDGYGTSGQVLTSTGSGVEWSDVSGGSGLTKTKITLAELCERLADYTNHMGEIVQVIYTGTIYTYQAIIDRLGLFIINSSSISKTVGSTSATESGIYGINDKIYISSSSAYINRNSWDFDIANQGTNITAGTNFTITDDEFEFYVIGNV